MQKKAEVDVEFLNLIVSKGILLGALLFTIVMIVVYKLSTRDRVNTAAKRQDPFPEEEPSPYHLKLELDEVLSRLAKLEASQQNLHTFQKVLYEKYPSLKKETQDATQAAVRKKRPRRRSNRTAQTPTPQKLSGE